MDIQFSDHTTLARSGVRVHDSGNRRRGRHAAAVVEHEPPGDEKKPYPSFYPSLGISTSFGFGFSAKASFNIAVSLACLSGIHAA
jgi:hypothetical protein